ncbi:MULTISPECIES: NADH-quinone oxidoreductase subunit L [Hyphomonas]|uniref:NADH-quinone oxidoreductase subunit L n=1 Tax=Hyphomonas adhaerens TaxID=81029 RepID=A0A3B9GVK0_9PROT|nr:MULTISPECIES: NADH-quinone oxidoreductase subunit L [Hyphomonas]MBB38616.1 NADH-quinone oxidoreductase subunit L [Hyphomonas sp.]HAE26460.1 NADH-quinone oxidoreductase subunit L [Hyphomonas adhaerens]|tara:strand:- start:1049 stop:3184 length:2136 start_codon:yes stop_codon:yes gene_type:complete
MLSDALLIFIVLAPGLVALTGLVHKFIGDKIVMYATTGVVLTAGALSLLQLFSYAAGLGSHGADAHAAAEHGHAVTQHIITLMPWINVGDFHANWAIRVDTLSIVMMAVITGVSGLVHLYSWGYMSEDPHKARFFAYLSLFTFAMLMLVTADNFIQLFFGWEGVGLASYLLIGFWYQNKAPNDASIKAFVTNRVGDFGLALGIMAVFCIYGTVEFAPFMEALRENTMVTPIAFADPAPAREVIMTFLGQRVWAVEVIGVLLFIGAMGKSAQFFLHVWLPDAMEGPTPVSALIHAATMVTAGVYLVCLLSPLYEYTLVAAGMITVVGAVTALYAATVGMAQNDIKRVIAYSTCSQLGYMFFAAGVGAYEAAMFHLFTHAFFKALLFLGAGSVIHGMHHEQDMRKMGGLAKFMPLTYAAMMIGTIAIIGLGVPHTKLGFAGFFSKDAILESAFAGGMEHVAFGQMAFWFGIVAAFLTSFYSWRLIYMTFHGPKVWEGAHDDDHAHAHDAHDDHAHDDHGHGHGHTPHESPLVMLIPLGLLSLGAIFSGFFFYNYFVDHSNEAFWAGAIYRASENHVLHARHEVPEWVIYAPLIVTLGGLLLATMTYLFNRGVGKRIADSGGPLYSLFYNKWYFDEIYNATLVRGAAFLGNIFWKADKKVIDAAGADGMTALTLLSARRLSILHTGRLYHYAFIIIGAALVFGALMWLNAGGAH